MHQLDIKAVREHLLPELDTAVRAMFKQALDELEISRQEAEHSEALARYYRYKIIQRDERIVALKKEILRAKDAGYEKGWDDAKR